MVLDRKPGMFQGRVPVWFLLWMVTGWCLAGLVILILGRWV